MAGKGKIELSRRAFVFGSRYCKDNDGATVIEYGLIGALIGVSIIVGVRRLGARTRRKMNCASRSLRFGQKDQTCS